VLNTFIATVDTTLVLISRRRAGRSWLAGGTDHVAHRLRRLGLTGSQVAWALMAVAAVTCMLGVLVAGGVLYAPAFLVGVVVCGVGTVWCLLRVPGYVGAPTVTLTVTSIVKPPDGDTLRVPDRSPDAPAVASALPGQTGPA
jgi:UDP-GlcNAc:undecaprenyl-phosphate GlcNAc-1-phosphate transferase